MKSKRLVMDIDDTLCFTTAGDYANARPNIAVINTLRRYQDDGFEIVLHSARNMRTHAGNIGKINVHTLPVLITWLKMHNVPYDEIIMGKPWCGADGFYVDDKAIRPDEFARLSYAEIRALISPTGAGITTAPRSGDTTQ